MSERVQIAATQLGFVRRDSGSNWESGQAYQGAYTGQAARTGVMFFSGLRQALDLENIDILEIDLVVTYGNAGSERYKTLGLYAATRSSLGGTGAEMRGAEFGQVRSNVIAYGQRDTLVFNSTTNAALYAKLLDWVVNGTTTGIVTYINEDPGSSSYSANYLTITAAYLDIEYKFKGSGAVLDKDEYELGDTATVTITPIESDYVLTHTLIWECESQSTTVSLAAGVTESTFIIPYSWRSEFAGAVSNAAALTVVTYEAGVEIGTRVLVFAVDVPERFAPVINSFGVERYRSYVDDQGQTQYEPSLSGAYVWVNLDAYILRENGNVGTATLRYRNAADETAQYTEIALTWTQNALILIHDRSIVTEQIELSDAFVFEVIATNGNHTVTASARVEKSWAPFHVAGTGYGVGVGRYSDGTENEPKFQVAWDAEFSGNVSFGAGAVFTDFSAIINAVYPVGAIYMSAVEVDPGELFPGTTWTAIEDRFLLAKGENTTAGATGGAESYSHSHTAPIMVRANGTASEVVAVDVNGTQSAGNGRTTYAVGATVTQGTLSSDTGILRTRSTTVSAMPPYLVVYMWRRTA